MHPGHTHPPVPPLLMTSLPLYLPRKKRKKREEEEEKKRRRRGRKDQVHFVLFLCSLEYGHIPSGQSPREGESFSTCTSSRSYQLRLKPVRDKANSPVPTPPLAVLCSEPGQLLQKHLLESGLQSEAWSQKVHIQ